MRKVKIALAAIMATMVVGTAAATEAGCWVTDTMNGRMLRVTPAGVIEKEVGGFNYPVCCAMDPRNGDVWVGDTGDGYVTKMSKNGVILTRTYVGSCPWLIAVHANTGQVWVANYYAHEIVKLNVNGGIVFRVPDIEDAYFVAVDPRDGACWTSDIARGEVIKIAANGVVLFRKKRPNGSEYGYGITGGDVDRTTGECVIYKGWISPVVKLDAQGNELWEYPAPGQWMSEGYSIAFDPNDGAIWVGETFYSAITKLTADGKKLFQITGLKFQPYAISVCQNDGSAYVVGEGTSANFVRLSREGVKLTSEKRLGGWRLRGVAAYAGGVAVTPASLGKIKALFH